MKSSIAIFAVALPFLALSAPADQGASNVCVSEITDQKMPTGDFILEFYLTGCSHCEEFRPVFEGASCGANGKPFYRVDCKPSENDNFCAPAKASGFPTVQFYQNGAKVSDYTGDNTAAGADTFKAWVSNPSAPQQSNA